MAARGHVNGRGKAKRLQPLAEAVRGGARINDMANERQEKAWPDGVKKSIRP